MSLQYCVNKNTGKWHIVGYCCHCRKPSSQAEIFDSEEELYERFGRKTIPCLLCQKKKEEILRKGD